MTAPPTQGPGRPPLERVGGLQNRLDDARVTVATLHVLCEMHAAAQATGSHAQRTWQRVADGVALAHHALTARLPQWLPGLPIGGDVEPADGEGSGMA